VDLNKTRDMQTYWLLYGAVQAATSNCCWWPGNCWGTCIRSLTTQLS